MKMTKKHRDELQSIKTSLQRGVDYLMQPEIVGIARACKYPNGGTYTVRNSACAKEQGSPEHITPMNKYVGSDITGIYKALNQLEQLLAR